MKDTDRDIVLTYDLMLEIHRNYFILRRRFVWESGGISLSLSCFFSFF
jgi:hypothetical protein